MRALLLCAALALVCVPIAPAGDLGAQLYGANCISCHGPEGRGIADRGPALRGVGARAADFYLRTGYMPLASPHTHPHRSRVLFSAKQITDAQLDSIIRYVTYTKHPDDRGGWALGHLGPVPEGLVTWFVGIVLLVATCLVIGKRLSS